MISSLGGKLNQRNITLLFRILPISPPNRHENKKLNKKAKHDLRIVRAEGDTAINEGRGEGLADIGEKVDGSVEIGGGRTVDDADDAESFAVRLKVLPGTGRRAAEDKLEAEGSGVPGLDGEGGLLVLCVEGANGGERDRVQREQHGVVVPQHVRRHRSYRNNCHLNHRRSFDAHFRLHCYGGAWLLPLCKPTLMPNASTITNNISENLKLLLYPPKIFNIPYNEN